MPELKMSYLERRDKKNAGERYEHRTFYDAAPVLRINPPEDILTIAHPLSFKRDDSLDSRVFGIFFSRDRPLDSTFLYFPCG